MSYKRLEPNNLDGYPDNYELSGYYRETASANVPFGGHPTLANGLLALWKFDGTVLTTPDPDFLGNPTVGAYTWDLVGAGLNSTVGKNGNAYLKNTSGSTYFSKATTDFKLGGAPLNDITIVAWVKRTSRQVYVFGCADGSPTFDYQMSADDHALMFVFDSGGGTDSLAIGSTGTPAGWNLQVGGFDSAQQKAFASCNGEAKVFSVDALDNGPKALGTQILTGLKSQSGTPGVAVDEMLVYNRVLTDPEISDLYAAGAGIFY